MVKYKINLLFNENGKSLNETLINILKIELEKDNYYFQINGSNN